MRAQCKVYTKSFLMRWSNPGLQSMFQDLALVLMLVTLWLLVHGYHGVTGDGQIYAFQALARLRPELASDLYLQNTSQDRFTLFSPLYAWCIASLGLENSARFLTLLLTLWFIAAVWSFARALAGRDAAWAAVALLLIVAGNYGGFGVFRILEPYLTARLAAQALIVTALSCQVRGIKRFGLLLALAALLIHPLMALPGVLLMICLWLPLRVGVIGAAGGVFATFGLAVIAMNVPMAASVFTVMDGPWLDIVRERSQFLFLQLWSMRDWGTNVQPFACLAFTVIAIPDERIRKLCAAGALVGAAGLGVAFVGNLIGPVAILVQGQAWRWVWITVFVSVVLLPVTAFEVWRDDMCGPLCAPLLVMGSALPGIEGAACVGLAALVWRTRSRINSLVAARYIRWLSIALGIVIGLWILIKCRGVVSPLTSASGRAAISVAQIQDMWELKIPAVLLAVLLWRALRLSSTIWLPVLLSATLAGFAVLNVPAAFRQARTLASSAEIEEFEDWVKVIPPTATVLVTPPHDVGTFVWFTLGRPNYLALDQSTGVVFSRTTALEVRRRSELLLPLMDPDWKILTRLRAKSGGGRPAAAVRPLTSQSLVQICTDPQLGFVISAADVGFDPLRHDRPGMWKDWMLYDCRKVRPAQSAT